MSFSYEGEENEGVLHDVSVHIRPGEMLAVVGPSGGGKSTLCQLIPRFYEVSEGAIRIDGEDVRSLTQSSLHRAIGIVQLNYRETLKSDAPVAQGDVISARGLGKFEVAEVGGLSKKGRTALLLHRYL